MAASASATAPTKALGRRVDHAQLPRRVQLVALDGADAGQHRVVLGVARRDAGEEALGQKLQLDVGGVEADEHEGARAPQLLQRRAQLAVGERRLQRLVRPQQRLRARRIAEQLPHERQLAVRAQRGAVARREQRRRDLVTHERAIEPVVAARGDHAAERQRAEAARRRRAAPRRGRARPPAPARSLRRGGAR